MELKFQEGLEISVVLVGSIRIFDEIKSVDCP